MEKYFFPASIKNQDELTSLEMLWLQKTNIEIGFVDNVKISVIEEFFHYYIDKLPDKFASMVLNVISEQPDLPESICNKLIESGDVGSRVSICLRNDISRNLLRKCLDSNDMNVISHVVFRNDVSIERCNKILEKLSSAENIETVKRAVKIKEGKKRD